MRLGKISEQLDRAAKIMQTRGWKQGGFDEGTNPDTCRVCVFSALAVAQGKHPKDWCDTEVSTRAGQFLSREFGVGVEYNDFGINRTIDADPSYTMINVVKAAAHLAREMGK